MSDSISDSIIFGIVMLLFCAMCIIVIDWSFSYNLHHKDWKCIDEVQVGDDILKHECITFKKRDKV